MRGFQETGTVSNDDRSLVLGGIREVRKFRGGGEGEG